MTIKFDDTYLSEEDLLMIELWNAQIANARWFEEQALIDEIMPQFEELLATAKADAEAGGWAEECRERKRKYG